MSDPFVKIRESTARRIIAGIRKIEQPEPLSAPQILRGSSPPGVRALLAQPLNGQGLALGVVTRRVTAYPLREISVLPIPLDLADEDFEFQLLYGDNPRIESLPISVNATAEELAHALEPWDLPAGSFHVTGGDVPRDTIPSGLPQPDEDLHLRRWCISFIGPQWEDDDPLEIVAYQPFTRVSGVCYVSETEWEPTEEVIAIREPGLLSPYSTSPFLHSGLKRHAIGTAVLCHYLPDAEAYVPIAAENKWFEDFQGLWRAWINANQWAKFRRHPDDVAAYVTDIERIRYETDVEDGWIFSGYHNLTGVGFGGFPGSGWGYWGYSGWYGNYGWGPYNGRPVKVRSSGTLPTPLLPDTIYYIREYNYFSKSLKLSETVDGPPIVLTDDGVGEHEILMYGDPAELI